MLLLGCGGTGGGTPPPATFVEDTFTDADDTILDNHTGEVGATWETSGDIFINGDALNCGNVFGNSIGRASGVPATAEYDIVITVTNPGESETLSAGILARCTAGMATRYVLTYEEDSTLYTMSLYKVVDGVETLIDFVDDVAVEATTEIKFEVRNATKKGFVNGVEKLSSNNNDIAAKGFAGVNVIESDATDGLHITSITATDA